MKNHLNFNHFNQLWYFVMKPCCLWHEVEIKIQKNLEKVKAQLQSTPALVMVF